ncbi:MAG: hypothetical protein ACOC6R_03925 [Chloroflexota bacterium]
MSLRGILCRSNLRGLPRFARNKERRVSEQDFSGFYEMEGS